MENEIPDDWTLSTVGEACEIFDSKRTPLNSSERSNRISGKNESDLYPYYGATGEAGKIDDYIFDGEYVLLGEDAAPFLEPIKGVAYIATGKFWVNNHAHILQLDSSNKFLWLYFLQLDFKPFVTGTTRLKLNQARLKDIPLPLPPPKEQKRIVTKIEELFSELDAGEQSLRDARHALNLYRQSLLKQAFEGKLTATWRANNPDKLEEPETLLARIQQEREDRYQQQLKDWEEAVTEWEANNKEGKKPSKPKPYPNVDDFTEAEIQQLASLPNTWSWNKIGNLFGVFVGATPKRNQQEFWDGDIPWVSSGEVTFCSINKTKEHITEEGLENTSTIKHPKGTIILAMIGEGKTRGQAAILNIEACHNQNTAAIRVSEVSYQPEFLYNFLLYRYTETRKAGSGNNQKALNKQRVSDLPTPLCSVPEQSEIIRILDEQFTSIKQNEKEIDHAINQSLALRQSILKKAFSGQLV